MPSPQPGRPFTPEETQTWHGFLVVHAHVIRRLDLLMQRSHGLTLVEFDVLIQLSLAGGQARMTQLADALLLSRSGLTRLIDALALKELVVREPDPADARATLAVLTRSGKRAVSDAGASHRANVRELFLDPLGQSERRAMASGWDTLSRQIAGSEPLSSPGRRGSGASAVRRRRPRIA
jgi:DNA-binding MarR family transcriptional regulator